MDCKIVNVLLDAGQSGPLAADVREHLVRCSSCRKAWEAGQAAAATLKGLPTPPVPAGFADRVLAGAYREAQRIEARKRSAQTWGLALAATFVLGIGVGLLVAWNSGGQGEGYRTLADGTVLLAPGDRTVVRLALDTQQAIGDVDFVIELPAGMELEGHPGEHEVAWHGELKQGRNVLGLPLIAQAGAHGVLTTELRHDTKDSVLKVSLLATTKPTWWIRLERWVA